MTERERLIELIVTAENEVFRAFPYTNSTKRIEMVVDYLISNGVIVPPVEIDTPVYEIRQKGKNYKGRKYDNSVTTQKRMKYPPICGATLYVKEKPFVKSDFCRLGGTIFLTREAAEKALAERRGET